MRPSRQPAHTRTLTVRLSPTGHERLAVEARLLDVRKRGVVEFAGHVHGPGVVHDIRIALVVARAGKRILDARLEMASVPFPPSARTAGEGCRDNEGGAAGLVGLSLEAGFLTGLHRLMGGARGCFHVFTLMRLVAATAVRAAGRAGLVRDAFSRTLTVDAVLAGGALELAGCLTDVVTVLGEGAEGPDAVFEVEAALDVALPSLAVVRADAAYRDRAPGLRPSWVPAAIAGLVGQSLARGYALALAEAVPARGALAPVHDLLQMVQPVAFQAMPAVPAPGGAAAARAGRRAAARDSCAMWRHGGPLARAIEEEARGGAQ